MTLLHAGEIYHDRDPRPLLASLQNLKSQAQIGSSGIRLKFLGRWSEARFDLPAAVRAAGVEDCVDLVGQVPHELALAAMRNADILLILQAEDSLAVPAKLYEYLSFGRPILALANPRSDIGWILETSGVTHRLVPPTDTDGVTWAIRDLVAAIRDRKVETTSADRMAMFSRAQVAARLAQKIDTLIASGREQQRLSAGA